MALVAEAGHTWSPQGVSVWVCARARGKERARARREAVRDRDTAERIGSFKGRGISVEQEGKLQESRCPRKCGR